jgi:hypothetical protein
MLPLIEEAAGSPVDGAVSIRHDPYDAIEETLFAGAQFDEILLFTKPHRIEGWLHIDLPHRIAHFGMPVTTLTAEHHDAGPAPAAHGPQSEL